MGLCQIFAFGAIGLGTFFLPVTIAAAPPIRCEIGLGAWCITEGAYEINRRLAQDSVNDRVWTLRGPFNPESSLVILEPNGCRQGKSDSQSLISFQHEYKWKGKSWDRAQLRLKSDGSCDLIVLFPAYSSDPMAWAFPEGFRRIRPCGDDSCSTGSLTTISNEISVRYQSRKR